MQDQIKKILSYNEFVSEEYFHTENLISQWKENKKDFIDWFGGEPIYKTPSREFHLSDKKKEHLFVCLINKISANYGCDELTRFLDDCRVFFWDNIVPYDVKVADYYNNPTKKQDVVIKKGTKLIRSFKHFVNNPTLLRKIQDEASQVLQQNKITGRLCFSVHPLDFLSMSENNCGWRSCQALDGDFRAAALAYMIDSSTVVAYIEEEDTEQNLARFPNDILWNSKKWRTLLHFSTDRTFVFASRQYPYELYNVLPIISQEFLNLPAGNGFGEWYQEQQKYYESPVDGRKKLNSPYIFVRRRLFALDRIVRQETDLFYNDLLNSHVSIPSYCWDSYRYNGKTPKVRLGSKVLCPICNEHYLDYSDSFICQHCRNTVKYTNDTEIFSFCDMCDCIIRNDEEYLQDDEGHVYCAECMNQLYICPECGQYRAIGYDEAYDAENERFICTNCFNSKPTPAFNF